jgi:hypothetical protein
LVSDLKSLVIQQIKQVFGNVKVFDEQVKQGLVTPAFLVLIIDNTQERKLKGQVSRTFTFNVTYFPESDDIHGERDNVYETFQNEFQYISNKYHVNKLESVKEDDMLVITFSIDVRLKDMVEGTPMQTIGGVTVEQK